MVEYQSMANPFKNLMLAANDWAGGWFPVVRLIILGVIVAIAIVLIVIIILQPANTQGLGAISGNSDTFFSKNKSKTLLGTLRRLTIICSITLAVLSIAFFILYMNFWY